MKFLFDPCFVYKHKSLGVGKQLIYTLSVKGKIESKMIKIDVLSWENLVSEKLSGALKPPVKPVFINPQQVVYIKTTEQKDRLAYHMHRNHYYEIVMVDGQKFTTFEDVEVYFGGASNTIPVKQED
jgi:hypothetical protein